MFFFVATFCYLRFQGEQQKQQTVDDSFGPIFLSVFRENVLVQSSRKKQNESKMISLPWRSRNRTKLHQLMVNCWFGLAFVILGVHPSNNPFHKGIPGIQTTNPNQQLTISFLKPKPKKNIKALPCPTSIEKRSQ